MNTVPALINKFSTFLYNHDVALANAFLILCTIGGEQTVEELAFNCPCSPSEATKALFSPNCHAWLYLILPAIFLFTICLMTSNRFWQVCQGCGKLKLTENLQYTYGDFCSALSDSTGRAILVGMSWIITALMDGDFYVCLKSINKMIPPTQETPNDFDEHSTTSMSQNLMNCFQRGSDEYKFFKSESQMWAWIVLVVSTVIFSILSCCIRCCHPSSYRHLMFKKMYRNAEKELYEKATQEWSKQAAAVPVNSFIIQDKHSKTDWDAVSLPNSLKQDMDKTVYSALDRLHKLKTPETKKKVQNAEEISSA